MRQLARRRIHYDMSIGRIASLRLNNGRALTAYASLREYRSTNKLDELRHGMVTSTNFSNPAIEWGWKHEATAVAEYVQHSGNKVIPSGIWLFPEGDLAACLMG